VLAACLTLQSQAEAQIPALDFAAALILARERSEQLVAERASRTAAEDMAVAAGQRPDPVLMAGIDNLPVSGEDAFDLTSDFMTMRSLGIEFELVRSERREARAAGYAVEAEVASASENAALAAIDRATAAAWLASYYSEAAHAELLRAREQAVLQIETADVAFRSGVGAESETLSARLALARLDDRIEAAARDVALARVALTRWVGEAAAGPLGEPPAMDSAGPHGEDIDTALAHHPELLLLANEAALARAQAEIARTDRNSSWTVGVMYEHRSPDYSNMMSVNASKPLRLNREDRQDRKVSAQLALARRASAALEEATRMHRAESETLLATWQANRTRLERFDMEILPLARDRSAAETAAYRGGTGSLESVLDARMAEIDAVLDRIALANETALTWAELHFLVLAGDSHE
jgi:outer membrane protein TolC